MILDNSIGVFLKKIRHHATIVELIPNEIDFTFVFVAFQNLVCKMTIYPYPLFNILIQFCRLVVFIGP